MTTPHGASVTGGLRSGYAHPGERKPRVAIVGAGFGGIATAVKLKKVGITDISVFEASDGAGGTWYDNVYPGCEVDTESVAYSFSFMPYDWSRTHCRQPELQRYAEDTIDHFGLRDCFRFGAKVTRVEWDDPKSAYRVQLETGEIAEFEIVVSAVGMLNIPKLPNWPGIADFRGPIFHAARWESQHDFRNQRVAVVGTGSTGAQLVSALARETGHVLVFQREPGWILPKGERDLTDAERAERLRHPLRGKWRRLTTFIRIGRFLTGQTIGSKTNRQVTQMCLDLIETSIEDPDLRKLVTPAYPFGCKRPVKASDFYTSLARPNVDLVPRAVAELTPTGIVDDLGVEREVDAVVLAIGFEAADYLADIPVVGPDGVSVHDKWAGQPAAYLGMTIPGVPNFFMVYGPNTNGGGPITAQEERQAELIARVVKRMSRRGYRRVDTRERALDAFVAWVDKHNLARTAQYAGCHNYFFSSGGRNATQWPTSHFTYAAMVRLGERYGLTYTR